MTKSTHHGPDSWPLPGKPMTNLSIQVALALVFVGAFFAFPIPMLCVLALVIAFFGGRAIIRELRKEWRQP